jgi:sugar fermentation stimulation protein A
MRLWEEPGPLYNGEVVERENRFVVRVQADDRVFRCHLSNPGELSGLVDPGETVYFRPVEDSSRKTEGDLVAAEAGDTLVYLPSAAANRVLSEVVQRGLIDRFDDCRILEREPKLEPEGRADFVINPGDAGTDTLVEVKSVSHAEDGVALFPDRPTKRGRRHLDALREHVTGGGRAMVVFVVQRDDVTELRPFREVDPVFAEKLEEALTAGAEAYAFSIRFDGTELSVETERLPIELEEPS